MPLEMGGEKQGGFSFSLGYSKDVSSGSFSHTRYSLEHACFTVMFLPFSFSPFFRFLTLFLFLHYLNFYIPLDLAPICNY